MILSGPPILYLVTLVPGLPRTPYLPPSVCMWTEREEVGERRRGRGGGNVDWERKMFRDWERLLSDLALPGGGSSQAPGEPGSYPLCQPQGETEKAVRVRGLCFSASEALKHICFGYWFPIILSLIQWKEDYLIGKYRSESMDLNI